MFKPKGQGFRFRFPRLLLRRPKKPLAFRHVFMISFIIFIGLTVWGLWLINAGIKPTLMTFAKTETQDVATKVLNVAVNKQIKEQMQDLDYVTLEKNDNGDVTAVSINAANVNMLMTTTTTQVQNYLTRLENGKLWEHLNTQGIDVVTTKKGPLIAEIPLGLATQNSLLANLGPKVPVRFHVIGNVSSSIVGTAQPVGINHVFLRVYIKITVDIGTIIPFATETQSVPTHVMIASELITEDTPLYYSGGSNANSPAIMLPFKKKGKGEFKIAP